MKQQAIKKWTRRMQFLVVFWSFLFILITGLVLYRPRIQLKGPKTMTIPMGENYVDPGTKVSVILGMKSPRVIVKSNLNMKRAGRYQIQYRISYLNGTIRKSRTVIVIDRDKPRLVLHGAKEMFVEEGTNYTEPGYQAIDNNDGDITKSVRVTGQVNPKKQGEYRLQYYSKDQAGNEAMEIRTIRVVPKKDPNLKTIYLTFDDGPSQVTPAILDVLKQHGVKATFFMIGKDSSYNAITKRVHDEGHTVAIHSNTHNYRYIYQSVDTYFKDLYELRARLKTITGEDANIIRFPGGSSNTVSKFQPGIMSTLTTEVMRRGFHYFDWNIDSGDTGRIGSDAIVKNVTSSLGNESTYVVLMHDYAANQQTADALDRIITYGKQNGYQFDRITAGTKPIHHGVNN
jgi:peptidoglycan/xylan/chitin deacetylase (PgdA/CDA1 family)